MSFPSSPAPYSPQRYASPYGGTDTPPPPPPKPSAHEQSLSRHGTPLSGPPLPAPPPGIARSTASPIVTGNVSQQSPLQGAAGGAVPQQAGPGAASPAVPQAPAIEEGWLPDVVKGKNINDLQTVLSDPTLISGLAQLHPSYAASTSQLRAALAANKAAAQHLKQLEAQLAALRASTESILLQHQSLDLAWRKKQAEVDAALEPWSPQALYQRLVAGIAEQEAVVRAVQESFLESGLEHGKASEREVVDWVRRLRAETEKLEARKEAKARWDEGRVGGWR